MESNKSKFRVLGGVSPAFSAIASASGRRRDDGLASAVNEFGTRVDDSSERGTVALMGLGFEKVIEFRLPYYRIRFV